MSYKIDEKEALGESIRRIVVQEIKAAITTSNAERNGKGSPVHRTRKHLKKARAALRLLAMEVGRERFGKVDRRLRNVGRLISEVRDAEVRLATVKQLRSDSDVPRSGHFDETEALLGFELESFLAAFSGWQEEAARKLQRARTDIAHWQLQELTRQQVRRTVRKSYRKGRKALDRARDKGSAKSFHQLRKRAKELWYQTRLLRPLGPEVFREWSSELATLGQHLGHAHDLSFVADRLRSIEGVGARRNRSLEALIDAREKDLLRKACGLGERFYALTPKKFSARIAHLFAERELEKAPRNRPLASVR